MKILITTGRYAPAVNGAVFSVLNLRRELVNRGHEVQVRTALVGKQIPELLDRGPHRGHSQWNFGTFFPARRIMEALGIPPVHTCHTVYERCIRYFSPIIKWSCLAEANFPGCLEVST